jgi:hypothetical protein
MNGEARETTLASRNCGGERGAPTAAPASRKRQAATVASMEGREEKSSRLLDSRDYGSSAAAWAWVSLRFLLA